MRRFLFLTFCGGLATLGGHASLSLGLHPEHAVPLTAVLQGCAALGVGAALFVTGMLGLAEAYEKQSSRLAELIQHRQTPLSDIDPATEQNGIIDRPQVLVANDDRFWSGYLSTTGGLIIALGGLLALVLIVGDISYDSYALTVGAGIAGVALPAMLLWIRGLVGIRRSHTDLLESARQVETYPEKSVEVEIEVHRRPSRGAVFRTARPSPLGRDLTRTSKGRSRTPRPRERF